MAVHILECLSIIDRAGLPNSILVSNRFLGVRTDLLRVISRFFEKVKHIFPFNFVSVFAVRVFGGVVVCDESCLLYLRRLGIDRLGEGG